LSDITALVLKLLVTVLVAGAIAALMNAARADRAAGGHDDTVLHDTLGAHGSQSACLAQSHAGGDRRESPPCCGICALAVVPLADFAWPRPGRPATETAEISPLHGIDLPHLTGPPRSVIL
jgi:hypothetical protein